MHSRRIIHRDIKPENVLMQSGTPRLADFGLSRVMRSTMHETIIAGTPLYMAPEAFKYERDEQTDIWAVGVMLYQLVSGSSPFPHKDLFLLIDAITNQEPPELPDEVPVPLQKVIATAMEKEQANRYKTADEMRLALKEANRLIEKQREIKPLDPPPKPEIPPEPSTGEETQARILLALKREAADHFHNRRYAEAIAKWKESQRLAPHEVRLKENIQNAENKLKEIERLKKNQKNRFRKPIIISISCVLLLAAMVLVWMKVSKMKSVNTFFAQSYSETVNGVRIEMVGVQSGTFTMGSPDNEQGRGSDESQHQVTVSSFAMGKYEVTQAQWRAVAALQKVKIGLTADPSKFKGDNLPVEQVRWEEAVEFCERLSKETGKTYRLPTEAEWEYACRAGISNMYTGNVGEMAWYDKNSDYKTHTVGQKKANAWGLYDMHGNVWEWGLDGYGNYSSEAQTDPMGSYSDSARVARGGGWYYDAQCLRSAYRGKFTPTLQGNGLGFRLVRTYN